MIASRVFGKTKDGRKVLAFTLSDGRAQATILNYGGIIQQILVPDNKGELVDVALGYDDLASYEEKGGYLGALIGRFANRIHEGRLTIDGKEYALYQNDNGNHLHGGKVGFDKKIWEHQICGDELKLRLFSPDGEENYPGNLQVEVVYSLRAGALKIAYRACSDKKTAVNLTNHVYFNLNGLRKESALCHTLRLDSDQIVVSDEKLIPMGEFKQVEGTPFDFRKAKEIGRDIEADDVDLKHGGGYDHCYILKREKGACVQYAEAKSERTGVKMTCYTSAPAVQLYTGNFLDQEGRGGYYAPRAGFCLETQAIPNNVNIPAYAALGNSIIDAGEEYAYVAIYEFSAE